MADNDKHGKAQKARRNFRTNGQNRGSSPDHAKETKYVRSGGPARRAARKARNHGCGKPALHRPPADQEHAHPIIWGHKLLTDPKTKKVTKVGFRVAA